MKKNYQNEHLLTRKPAVRMQLLLLLLFLTISSLVNGGINNGTHTNLADWPLSLSGSSFDPASGHNNTVAGSDEITEGFATLTLSAAFPMPATGTGDPPVSGYLTKTPDVTNVCEGTNVSATLTPGTGGNGTDETESNTFDGTSWSGWISYSSGTDISTTGKTEVQIHTRRMADSPDSPDFYSMQTWTVFSAFTPGEIAATGQTICYNTSPTTAIVNTTVASGGDNSIVYSWRASTDSYVAVISGANLATYTPTGPLTATTSYRRYAKDGTCVATPAVATGTWTVTVRPVFSAGSIKKLGETICYNGNPALIGDSIAASGGDASIAYQWQSSLNAGFTGTPTDIATNAASYDPPTGLTATTWYRRQAKDATCNLTFTSSAQVWKVTVNPTSNGGNISGGATVCYGTNSTLLSLYGQTGTVVKWQYTTDAGYNWYDITNTNATYTATNLITTTGYRAVVQSGVCSATPGGYAGVTVRPVFTAGSIKKSGESICYNEDPAQIGDSIPASGGDAAIEYQWQSSLDAGFTGTPTDIATNAASYDPPTGLTATTWYRRQAKEGTCNTTFTTSAQVWKVTVRPVFSAGSIKKLGETICYNGNPALIGDSIAASGGDASIAYQWQSSLNAGFTGTPTDIATNAASYDPPTGLTATTWYRRQAKDATCNLTFTSSAQVWKVTVNPTSNGGNISGGATVCYGTNSTLLSLYGQTGTVVKWQYTTDAGYNWYDITNTNATYTATNLITTTGYRAVVQSGVCSATPGGYAGVTVRPVFTAGSIKKSGESICYNEDPAQIGDSIPASGGDAAIEYQWQSSLDAGFTGTPTDIATNAASYNPPANLTATTWYRRQAKEGTCNTTFTTSAQIWKVTVNPQLFASASVITNVDCHGNNTGSVEVTVSGGTSGYGYAWSTDPVQTTALATALTTGTYSVVITDANYCTITTSVTVTQPNAPLSATASTTANVDCYGNSTGSVEVSVSGGTTAYSYVWSTSPAQTASAATGLVNDTYSVVVTDVNGCTATSSAVVTQPLAPLFAEAGVVSHVSCYGGHNGSADVSVSGGTTLYYYAWSSNPVQTTATATGLTVGTYSVTVTDANGCSVTSSATLTQPVQWWPTVTGSTPVCQNSTGNIFTTDAGMSNYQWVVPAGGVITAGGTATDNTVTVTWTGFGPKTVKVNYTRPDGCTAVEAGEKALLVNVAPTPAITGDPTVTQAQVVTYETAYSPGFGYTWNASHGNPLVCFPNRNCLTITWDFPCGVIGSGYVTITETNMTTGCSTTATQLISITP